MKILKSWLNDWIDIENISNSEISEALERDNFMTADEAKKFGLVDSVVEKRK